MENYISLSELNLQVKEKIQKTFSGKYRITAEINELRESRGHAYLELIEKSEDDTITAKAGATIWARTYGMLKAYFESSTGHYLEFGIKVLVVVQINFHEVFGYSLNIIDIDPAYTIGEIEQKRRMIIKRLEEEGVIEMNKELYFPDVPQRIAVISSETAAGFGDFKNQLQKSSFYFEITLFTAAMQGKETEDSVVNALEEIFLREDEFDLVVIIRGGGSKSDLSWFDSYKIAVNIAQFPLPVLTGIGHERDLSVTDLTAYKSLNTPTAVAEFLVNKMNEFYFLLESYSENLNRTVKDILEEKKQKLNETANDFKYIIHKIFSDKKNELKIFRKETGFKIKQRLNSQKYFLEQYSVKVKSAVSKNLNNKTQYNELLKMKFKNRVFNKIENEKHKIAMFEQKNNLIDPIHVLKSGYTYTLSGGKLLKTSNSVKKDEVLETVFFDGKIISIVKKTDYE